MSPQPASATLESRLRWAATLTLGLVLAGHSLMETGRDALFLANITVEHLPWVTIAIAGLALVIARTAGRGGAGNRRRLIVLQTLAAALTFGFWWLLTDPRPWVFYALYVWSGVITSIVVVSFWLLLSDLFTITQGKRLYASIALGGSLGALTGSGLAALLTTSLGAEALLIVASFFFAASLAGPLTLLRADGADDAERRPRLAAATPDERGLAEGLRNVLEHPYAARVALIVALAGATLTLGDYLFKSVLAELVAPDRLAMWLARIYLGLNLLSIGTLAVAATPLVRRLGVDRSLAVLPGLVGLAALGVLGAGALTAVGLMGGGALIASVVLLKGADGTLRYSLHKTAAELLYLPMPPDLRNAVKGFIDIVGQSGAKALASLLILGLVTLPDPRFAVSCAVLVLALAWMAAALEIRGAYLDVFRRTLSEGSIETRLEHPELDLASLEALIRALNEPDERRVRASMALLVERDRASLIPSLILYHPSAAVVAEALDVFATTRREDVLVFVERLLDHEDPGVRAAAVRASWLLSPERQQLEELTASECPCVRVSAVTGRVVHGWIDPHEASRELAVAAGDPAPYTRMALAHAAKLRYAGIYREPLLTLARDADEEVAREAVRAIRASEDPWFTAPLVQLLDQRGVRDLVRDALLDRGDEALEALARTLLDGDTPFAVRRHVPRTLSRFATPQAAEILLEALPRAASGMVRYKILRGLEPLLKGSVGQAVDTAPVAAELDRTLERALFLLQQETELERGRAERPERLSVGSELLLDLVRDKQRLAVGRLFQILGLLHPDEDFRSIRGGIRSSSATSRASSTELLENLLSRPVGRALLGVLAEGSAGARLREADPARAARRLDYAQVVLDLTRDESQSLRALALYHAGELQIAEPEGVEPAAEREARGAGLIDQALGALERLPDALAGGPATPARTGG